MLSGDGRSLLMQLTTPVCVLRGPRCVVELANPQCCELWGCAPSGTRFTVRLPQAGDPA